MKTKNAIVFDTQRARHRPAAKSSCTHTDCIDSDHFAGDAAGKREASYGITQADLKENLRKYAEARDDDHRLAVLVQQGAKIEPGQLFVRLFDVCGEKSVIFEPRPTLELVRSPRRRKLKAGDPLNACSPRFGFQKDGSELDR